MGHPERLRNIGVNRGFEPRPVAEFPASRAWTTQGNEATLEGRARQAAEVRLSSGAFALNHKSRTTGAKAHTGRSAMRHG